MPHRFKTRPVRRTEILERAVMEALAVREAVFNLDDPDLIRLVDALLRGLGQAASRTASTATPASMKAA